MTPETSVWALLTILYCMFIFVGKHVGISLQWYNMPGPMYVSSLSCIVSKSVSSIIWPLSFFVHKCSTGKRITLRLWVLANRFIWIWWIVCRVTFRYTITTCSSGFRIRIVITTLLFIITTSPLLKRPLLACVSIAEKGLSSCCCICSFKVMTNVNWFYMPLSWISSLVIG